MHRARRVGELFAAFVVEDLHAAGRGEDVDPLEGVFGVHVNWGVFFEPAVHSIEIEFY